MFIAWPYAADCTEKAMEAAIDAASMSRGLPSRARRPSKILPVWRMILPRWWMPLGIRSGHMG